MLSNRRATAAHAAHLVGQLRLRSRVRPPEIMTPALAGPRREGHFESLHDMVIQLFLPLPCLIIVHAAVCLP